MAIEDAVPLNHHIPDVDEDPDFDIPIWIHQNILKLAKEFGIDIKGCREEAATLFLKIDSMRKNNMQETENGKEIQRIKEARVWEQFQEQWH